MICSMLRRNSRRDIVIFFLGCVIFIGMCGPCWAQRPRCALKLVRCLGTWVQFFKIDFPKKKLMETSPKVAVVIPNHYGVISQHYGIISRNHYIIHFPLFLLLMDLQSPWRKGVLYCSGCWDHLFVSQAYAW